MQTSRVRVAQTEAELMDSLRRFRRRHMVRIAWRDIAGWADLDETLRDLSDARGCLHPVRVSHARTTTLQSPLRHTARRTERRSRNR